MKNFTTLCVLFVAALCISSSPLSAQTTPLKVSLGSGQKICYGGFAQLHAAVKGGQAPYSFQWNSSEDLSSTTDESVVATPGYTASYRVVVTDASGATASSSVEVEVNQHPVVDVPAQVSIERGDVATLQANVSGGAGGYSYTWRPGTGLDDTKSSSPKAKPDMTTTYSVTVKDSKGCVETKQVSVNIVSSAQSSVGRK